MVGLADIPKTTDEDGIDRMPTEAGITHFDIGQIDVVHRTSPKASAPIIILFIKKSDGINFYYQNKRFYLIDAASFVEKQYDNNKSYGFIYLNESLTPQNRLFTERNPESKQRPEIQILRLH